MTDQQLEAAIKHVAMTCRAALELNQRYQVLTEQVAKLLCGKDAPPEKVQAVTAEINAEANRRIQKCLIDLDKTNPELAALMDDFPSGTPAHKPPAS